MGAFRLHTPPPLIPGAGTARQVDYRLALPEQNIGNVTTLITSAMGRGGASKANFLINAAGAYGFRNGRACNVHNDGNGGIVGPVIPHRIGTAHGGALNPAWAGLVAVRVLLAINATADADATLANPELGLVFFPADGRSTINYHQLLNDAGNNRDRGFGLIRRAGGWRFMARTLDNDGNAVPVDIDVPLPWPTADVEQFVMCDFIFRQQTSTTSASLELQLDGNKVLTQDWGAGSKMPRPDTDKLGTVGPAAGWGLFFRSVTGPAADGRELRIADVHYIAGPDGPGVLW